MPNKQSLKVYRAAEDQESDADYSRGKYLRANGWEHTSSTPGCVWMWCKVWEGKQWTYGSAKAALRAQMWMEDFPDEAIDGVTVARPTQENKHG